MLVGAGAGDPDSWASIMYLYTPLVRWWCRQGFPRRQQFRSLCPVPSQDAADVVQQVFLTVYRRIKTFTKDGKPAAFRRWLYVITYYKVREYWKRRSREVVGNGGSGPSFPEVPDPAPPPGVFSGSSSKDSSENDDDPVTTRDWRAFWEHSVKGRSADEVANELGIPPCEVDAAESRVLKHFRELDEDGVHVRVLLLRRLLDLIRPRFKSHTWAAFWKVTMEGRSAKDVAEELCMNVCAVHTANSRARMRLREEAEALEFYSA
jgi:RNA polymerase sigma-70 factor (ECF subfamily)